MRLLMSFDASRTEKLLSQAAINKWIENKFGNEFIHFMQNQAKRWFSSDNHEQNLPQY